MSVNAIETAKTTISGDSKVKIASFFGPFVDPGFVTLVNRVMYGVVSGIISQDSTETRVRE